MDYNKIRKKLNKYAEGGKLIPKYQSAPGALPTPSASDYELRRKLAAALGIDPEDLALFSDEELNKMYIDYVQSTTNSNSTAPTVSLTEADLSDAYNAKQQQRNAKLSAEQRKDSRFQSLYDDAEDAGNIGGVSTEVSGNIVKNAQSAILLSLILSKNKEEITRGLVNSVFSSLGFSPVQTTKPENEGDLDENGLLAMGIASQGVSKILNLTDDLTMGDKNFSALSLALDSTVHGASGALMKSGNPYAMLAGAAMETLNFMTKAGGKTVPGYDVNINNAGYGDLGHKQSESTRDWGALLGIPGVIPQKGLENKIAKRNEQARMATAAADISEGQAYQQEARANSITNVLQANQIALAGGIDTSLLGN